MNLTVFQCAPISTLNILFFDMNYEKREQCNNKQAYEKPNKKKKMAIWMEDFVTK